MQSVSFTTAQKIKLQANVMDKGTPPRRFKTLPEGASIEFSTTDEEVAPVTMLPDGLSCEVASNDVGTATITITPRGTWQSLPAEEVEVTIINAEPDALNVTIQPAENEA
jgi:hypothetical protein